MNLEKRELMRQEKAVRRGEGDAVQGSYHLRMQDSIRDS